MAAAGDDTKLFQPLVLVDKFRRCASYTRDIPIEDFLQGCEEVKKIVYSLGTAFTIASADITEKVAVLRERTKAEDTRVRFTLQWLVLDEMSRDVHKRNDSKFVSGSRSLLRLMWFLDFLNALISRLLNETDGKELRLCAQEAYDEALAHHHPWILRKTIGAAMYLLPSKDSFLSTLAGDSSTPAELRPRLQDFLNTMNPVRAALWAFYDANGIRDLP